MKWTSRPPVASIQVDSEGDDAAGNRGYPATATGWDRRTGRGGSRRWIWVSVLASMVAIFIIGDLVHVPYVAYRPGPAVDTLGRSANGVPLISITGAPTYPTSGTLDFTTVSMSGAPGFDLTGWDFIGAKLDPQAELRPRDEVFPPEATRDEVTRLNKAQMSGSQQEAVAVALRALGRVVPEKVVVREVATQGPAAKLIRPGDVVLAVGPTEIARTKQVTEMIQRTPADRPVTLRVLRGRRAITLSVPTVQLHDRRIVGISLEPAFTFPITVKIDAGEVGGPSAGMMFALGVYDKLTTGPLTGGQSIAGTGTIDGDGTIGPIDGVSFKMIGAVKVGARWFLVPADNCGDVVGHVPSGLRVVRVATFEQAKNAVAAIGAGKGASLAGCG